MARIEPYLLNLAGEYRICSELNKAVSSPPSPTAIARVPMSTQSATVENGR